MSAPSPDRRSNTSAWATRGLVAALILAAVTCWGTAAPVASAQVTAIPAGGRIMATPAQPLALPGVPRGSVRSVLNVRESMRYGQFFWDESGVPPGRIVVRIDREAQIMSVFRAGHEIGTAVVMYGTNEKPTPAGRYPVLGKEVYHRSRAYNADMPFTMWLTRDGVAIHASNVRQGGATHGCIGVPADFAKKLFYQIRAGDPVIIV